MERNQFTFYKSFFDSVQKIRKATDRAKAYEIICDFALYGNEPDLDSLPDAISIVFTMVKPVLEASRKKAESGKQGGSKRKANVKQTEANGKQEKEQDKDKDKDKDKEQMLIPTLAEVEAYCSASGLKTDPSYFWYYYQSRGWTGVRDWKARIQSWEKNNISKTDSSSTADYQLGDSELDAIRNLRKLRDELRGEGNVV